MSWKVKDLVETTSRSRRGTRMVATVLAGIAHHDGVVWATIKFEADDPQWKKKRSIAYRAGLDERQVRRALQVLQGLDELETIVAFDGRRRFYIHRLILGELREEPPDYSRGLPKLAAPFWTVEELLLPKEERPTEGHVAPWIERPTGGGNVRSSDETTGGGNVRSSEGPRADIRDVDERTPETATGGPGGPLSVLLDRSQEPGPPTRRLAGLDGAIQEEAGGAADRPLGRGGRAA